jgi:hypothetical protein
MISELQAHPGDRNVIWNLASSNSGRVAVAFGRGGPTDLSYEIQRHAPVLVVWLSIGIATPNTALHGLGYPGRQDTAQGSCLFSF